MSDYEKMTEAEMREIYQLAIGREIDYDSDEE